MKLFKYHSNSPRHSIDCIPLLQCFFDEWDVYDLIRKRVRVFFFAKQDSYLHTTRTTLSNKVASRKEDLVSTMSTLLENY